MALFAKSIPENSECGQGQRSLVAGVKGTGRLSQKSRRWRTCRFLISASSSVAPDAGCAGLRALLRNFLAAHDRRQHLVNRRVAVGEQHRLIRRQQRLDGCLGEDLAGQQGVTLDDWYAKILETIPVGRYGRPADVALADDGSILIADDYAGAIYRVVLEPPERSP